MPLPDADFIAACAHKLGGPPGVGVLLVRDLATLEAVGGQEKGYRRGTQDVPSALGVRRRAGGASRMTWSGWPRFARGLMMASRRRRRRDRRRQRRASPTIGAYRHARRGKRSLLVQFDLAGIAVSAGSACSSGAMKASAVLAAMDVAAEIAGGFLRISFGPRTSEADVDRFLGEWRRIAERAPAKAA